MIDRFHKTENKWICSHCGKLIETNDKNIVVWHDFNGEARAHKACDVAYEKERAEIRNHCWEYEKKHG